MWSLAIKSTTGCWSTRGVHALRGAHLGDRGRAPVAVPSRIDADHYRSGPDGHRRSRAATSPAPRAVAAVSLNSRHPGFHCTNRRRAHLGPVEPLPKTGGGPGVYNGQSSPFNKPPRLMLQLFCQRGDMVFPFAVSDRFRSGDRVHFFLQRSGGGTPDDPWRRRARRDFSLLRSGTRTPLASAKAARLWAGVLRMSMAPRPTGPTAILSM